MSDSESSGWLLVAYGSLLVSCTAFGCMFVPLRNKSTKDGFFVQWIECAVVFIAGCIIYSIREFPKFEPVAAIGGLLYATGNVFSVPIINGIGMGVGFLVWSSLQILVGWGVARFGLFNLIEAQPVKIEYLNYIGIGLTLISGVLLLFVDKDQPEEREVETDDTESNKYTVNYIADYDPEGSAVRDVVKKFPFFLMACALAVMHGLMMSPIDYLKQHNPSDDKFRVFDYIFPFYTSVFLFSTVYFFGYSVVLRKRAHIEPELIVPSIAYGILWTTGMTLWFLSSDRLSQVVAYPITTRLPPLISAFIDVFIYKNISLNLYLVMIRTIESAILKLEISASQKNNIQSRNSRVALLFAALFAMVGVVLIAISNQL